MSTIKYVSFDSMVELWLDVRSSTPFQQSCMALHAKRLPIHDWELLSHIWLKQLCQQLLPCMPTKQSIFGLLSLSVCGITETAGQKLMLFGRILVFANFLPPQLCSNVSSAA